MNPNQNPMTNPSMPQMQPPQNVALPKQSHASFIVAILMTIFFLSAAGFGIWAFAGMQENKSNLDEKIEAASAVAVENAEAAKEVDFAEREKNPFKQYAGPAQFGSLGFSYPKTWSVYVEQAEKGTVLDLYAHPNQIAGLGSENSFAYRVQILSTSYDREAEKIQKLAEDGKATVSVFRPVNVPSELGLRAVGEINNKKQGVLVLLPQRDKTIRIWTESNDFATDFDAIIASLTFVP